MTALQILRSTAVGDVMTYPPITLHPNDTLTRAKKVFGQYDINHGAVVDGDRRPIGMVSTSDLARLTNWKAFFQPELQARNIERLLDTLLVEDVMRAPVVTLTEVDTVQDAAELIDSRRFHAIPVTSVDGVLTGMITAHDLLRLAFPSAWTARASEHLHEN